MSEDDYVIAGNVARLRIARAALREAQPGIVGRDRGFRKRAVEILVLLEAYELDYCSLIKLGPRAR